MLENMSSYKDPMIIIDFDDCAVDYVGGFKQFAIEQLGRIPQDDLPSTWAMSEWLECSNEEYIALIKEFNMNREEFAYLKPIPGVVNAMNYFRDAGVRRRVLTSCSTHPATVERRVRNANDIFGVGMFEAIDCLDLGQKKSDILQKYKGAIWVEDNYNNALAGHNLGLNTIMFRRSHNLYLEAQDTSGIKWVDTWDEIVEYAKEKLPHVNWPNENVFA